MTFRSRKPAWLTQAQTASKPSIESASPDSSSLFHRSANNKQQAIKEAEREYKEVDNKKKRTSDGVKASKKVSPEPDEVVGRHHKRRRVSDPDEDASESSDTSIRSRDARRKSRDIGVTKREIPAKANTTRDLPERSVIKEAHVIELDDSSDSEKVFNNACTNARPSDPKSAYPDEEEEDAELAALEAQARARLAERRTQQQDTILSTLIDDPAQSPEAAAADTELANPKIEVFLDARIPDTIPLRVIYRYRNRLSEMRKAWCGQQPFWPPGIRPDDVILAFKNQHVLDYSTIQTLGIELNGNGDPIMRRGMAGIAEAGNKIVIAATTQTLLDMDIKAEEEARLRRERGEEPLETEENIPDFAPEEIVEQKPADSRIRLTLRAKGYNEYRLQVKADTSFERIANAFKKAHSLAPATEVTLMFDGDELELDTVVGQSEIEDMDFIDITVK